MNLLVIKDLVERSAFGVCSYLGDKFGIQSAKIRLYFIYTSFVTMGSPIIIYLIMAWWLNIKKYVRQSYAFLS
ncbi:MAG: PspC domain-containing protein [Saprospiraceae bacterium]|nr:PspC domain-containing protein [Saprospiraceae bacterium]